MQQLRGEIQEIKEESTNVRDEIAVLSKEIRELRSINEELLGLLKEEKKRVGQSVLDLSKSVKQQFAFNTVIDDCVSDAPTNRSYSEKSDTVRERIRQHLENRELRMLEQQLAPLDD